MEAEADGKGSGTGMGSGSIVYLNGEFLERDQAQVSVFDRGFLYGDTVYETLRTHKGRPIFWDDHLRRLRRSCELVHFEIEWEATRLESAVSELLHRNRLGEARVRITVSRGLGDLDQLKDFVPTWVITAAPLIVPPDASYQRGVEAVLVEARISDNAEAKSGNYLNNLLARREARLRGAFEGIMCNGVGHLAEGASCNLFWVLDDRLETPAATVGLLKGVTRAKLIEIARDEPSVAEVREVEIGPEGLEGADEIFLTNTTWEVLPVTRWEGRPVGTGAPGPTSRLLRRRLRSLYPIRGEES